MSEPMVTALGHAGLRIDGPGVRVLADPWLSPGGAFLGSWFQFPDNAHLLTRELLDVDVVVVSHEHLDHLDLDLIAGLPEAVPVVVPRYPSTIMQRRLRAVGRTRIVVLDAWERHALNDRDWLTVIPEQCPMSHDSAVLFKIGDRSVMHTNDARISLSQTRRAVTEVGGPLDVMGVQMSGASWHPVRYEYDEVERERIATIKRIGKFKAVTRLVRQVQPRLVMPYAGPPCFLDDDLFELNSGLHPGGIFPDQGEAVAWLADRIPEQDAVCLLPGDRILLEDLSVVRDPHWNGFALDAGPDERRRYLKEYAARRRPAVDAAWAANPEPQPGLAKRFKEHVESLGTLSEYFLARIGMTLRFQVMGPNGGLWDAHIGPDRVWVDLDGGNGHADYRLTLDGRWLDGVVSGRTRWEELLLSLRFTARRQPDRYNDYLVGLFKHADRAALRAVELFETARDPEETIEINSGGKQLSVSRYCPHAGEDLAETGVVLNGVLRCLGHNFEFDLASGQCLNARCDPIVVRSADVAYEDYEDAAV
ncbi:UDP-MurNAc hydroxylase [Kribbella pratensis]|uniref:UDP-MurNAc hydroxylase n=1 Tax=Kribbella pratensis TaxID=2512112 RepID=A0ABY2FQK9_9ACTN|nr:MBL fold metallo-hydrolase [Kribbella pratensis]TDW95435.1 UDP-MurNAc hydroxylase [Kribbella pratensis]